ncbi:MAG: PhoH family protein [Phycisphaerales bacterium]
MTSRTATESTTRKHFVLDTNVLLHNPAAIQMFDEHEIVIPLTVIEELDNFKKNSDDTGRNSRQIIRAIDALRAEGHLFDGVSINDRGGTLRIDRGVPSADMQLDPNVADHKILAVAKALVDAGQRTVFVSKDINARVKADALGIPAEDFEAQKVDADWLYTGFSMADVTDALIDELYDERQLPMERVLPMVRGREENPDVELHANQFLVMHSTDDPAHSGLARRLGTTDHVIPVTRPRRPIFGVMARNVEQTMALDLLLDDDVKLVTLLGTAGTGKTLLALAAGMQAVFKEQRFDKLLAARPIMPLGRDIGYLPGDKDEKLAMWMQPIFDNLMYLLSTRGSHLEQAESRSAEQHIDRMLDSDQLVLEPLTYIRGRSIPHQFFIVDEAQNLTPHEVKTIISRAGDGTKVVLTGDINQIDNPYLDASSNGLSYTVERMKGQPMAGHVTLQRSERSQLASLAAEIL